MMDEESAGDVNWGVKVNLRLTAESIYQGATLTLRNVTEIHFNYPPDHCRTAFESGLHGTGITYTTADIAEFETEMETSLCEEGF